MLFKQIFEKAWWQLYQAWHVHASFLALAPVWRSHGAFAFLLNTCMYLYIIILILVTLTQFEGLSGGDFFSPCFECVNMNIYSCMKICVCVCFWLSAMYIIFHSIYLSIFCMFEDIMYKDCAVGNSLSLVLWVCQTSACRVSFDDLCFILIGTSGVGWLALMYRALVLVYIEYFIGCLFFFSSFFFWGGGAGSNC